MGYSWCDVKWGNPSQLIFFTLFASYSSETNIYSMSSEVSLSTQIWALLAYPVFIISIKAWVLIVLF